VRLGRLSGTTLKPHYAHKVDQYECSGQDVHGILSSSKCFLETILNDAARVLRMDELGHGSSGRDSGCYSVSGRAENTRSGFRTRSG